MPELFLELFSEEIPARMQVRAEEVLQIYMREALQLLSASDVRTFSGPRRIAFAANVSAGVPAVHSETRGPRENAPDAAVEGFLKKTGATRVQLVVKDGYFTAVTSTPGRTATEILAFEVPKLIRRFTWPKSMRWGGTSALTWVRPLRRITCLLDGHIVPFDLRDGEDDGHGLVSSDLSEGHRFLSPGAFAVTGAAQWQDELRARHVLVDAAERKARILEAAAALAQAKGCTLVDDPGLLDEVSGLVEWPVVMLGRIDAAYMDLPAEVMQVSMRVNQRYFALRNPDGSAAPWFAFAGNIVPEDGGAATIAGNERVLRARFADARHFWDLDRARRLDSRVAALDAVTFHAELGSQGARVRRLVELARILAPLVGADPALAERAALLAKADLTTGMVGEFPELQGVMGGYYALRDGEGPAVAAAIREHYAPKGPGDSVPAAPVSVAVALADKLDLLAGFFAIGQIPTGSGDPYALRRAALGVIRIVRENRLRLDLVDLVRTAGAGEATEALAGFIAERLRVQLRAEGARHDVLAAVLAKGLDGDLTRLLARTDAVAAMLGSEDGANLLEASKRAANILRIEEKKDGPHDGPVDPSLLTQPEEAALAVALDTIAPAVADAIGREEFSAAMVTLASLRPSLGAFFDSVTVNDPEPRIRRNRLALLARVRAAMGLAADFSKIEG